MNKSIFAKLIVFSLVPTCAFLAFFYGLQYYPLSQRVFDSSLQERIKTISLFAVPQISRAVRSNDDISLLLISDNILKSNEISSLYILDKTGKVIAHNKVSEWGKTFNDALSVNALNAEKDGFIKAGGNSAYTSKFDNLTLVLTLNLGRRAEAAELIRKNILYSCIAVLALSILYFTLLFNHLLSKNFRNITETLKSISLGKEGKINSTLEDEFGSLSALIDNIIERFSQNSKDSAVPVARAELNALIEPIIEDIKNGLIMIDSENRIIAINKYAMELLALPEKNYFETHIVDLFSDSALMDAVREAIATKTSVYETTYSQIPVRILLPNGPAGNTAGIIIFVG